MQLTHRGREFQKPTRSKYEYLTRFKLTLSKDNENLKNTDLEIWDSRKYPKLYSLLESVRGDEEAMPIPECWSPISNGLYHVSVIAFVLFAQAASSLLSSTIPGFLSFFCSNSMHYYLKSCSSIASKSKNTVGDNVAEKQLFFHPMQVLC